MPDDTDLDALSHCALADIARVRPVLDKIADKWTIMILCVLCPKPARFNAIKRRLDGITHKALAEQRHTPRMMVEYRRDAGGAGAAQ